jgi:parallel beta-helix repeat protein
MFLTCQHDRLEARNSTFENGNAISCNDSAVDVSDTLFDNEYSAIGVRNSELTVDNCRILGCNNGIQSSADMPGNHACLLVHGTVISANGSYDGVGVAIKNLSASIEDSDILAPAPVVILPPDGLSGGGASLASFANISNNFIQVDTTYSIPYPGITIFSSIPFSGLDSLVRANRWNATMPVARYLRINETSHDQNHYYSGVNYNSTGMAVEYDGEVRPLLEHRFDDGWASLPISPKTPERIYGTTTGVIPMDVLATVSTGYCWSRLDGDAVALRKQTDAGTGTVKIDPSAAQRPSDILQVDLSVVDAPFEPVPLDIQLYGLRFAYDPETNALIISVGIDSTSPKPEMVNVTLVDNGRTLDSGESPPWSGIQGIYAWDMANLSSGELSVSVAVPGTEEANLSNNRVAVPLRVVENAQLLEGASDISGIWCLRNGSSLAIRHCNMSIGGRGVYIIGDGSSRIDIAGSTLNFTTLGLFNCSGRINDSELFGDSSDYSSSNTIDIEGGIWDIENVTVGCRASDFERMAREYRDDPGDVIERNYYTGNLSWVSTWMTLDVAAENMTCRNLSDPGGYCDLRANSTFIMAGSRFMRGYIDIACQGNATILDNKLGMMWAISLAAGSLTAENNTFSDNTASVYVEYTGSHCTLRENEFIVNLFQGGYMNATGLNMVGDGPPVLEGNVFTNLSAAMQKRWPGPMDMTWLRSNNRFVNIRSAIAYSQKSLTLQLDYEQLCLMANRKLDRVQLFWSDSLNPGSYQFDTTYVGPVTQLYRMVSLYDWSMDTDGSEKRVDQLKVHLVATSFSGSEWSRDLEFTIPEADSWTETIG